MSVKVTWLICSGGWPDSDTHDRYLSAWESRRLFRFAFSTSHEHWPHTQNIPSSFAPGINISPSELLQRTWIQRVFYSAWVTASEFFVTSSGFFLTRSEFLVARSELFITRRELIKFSHMLRDVTHTFWSENRVQDCAVRLVAVAAGRGPVQGPLLRGRGQVVLCVCSRGLLSLKRN